MSKQFNRFYYREIGYDKAFKDFQKSDKYKKAQEKKDKEDGGEGGTGGTPIQRIDVSKLSTNEANKVIKTGVNQIYKDLGYQGSKNALNRKQVRDFIYSRSGLPQGFDLRKASIEDLSLIHKSMFEISPISIKKMLTKGTDYRKIERIERNRVKVNITEADHRLMMKNLGIKDSNLFEATNKQLKAYEAIIHQMKKTKNKPEPWLDDIISQGLSKNALKIKNDEFLGNKKNIPSSYNCS